MIHLNWKRCAEIAQVITALVSVFATGAAVYFSNRAVNTATEALLLEREYKEASIFPAFSFQTNALSLKFSILNHGSGPGLIKRVLIYASGNCLDSDRYPSVDKWREDVGKATHGEFQSLVDSLPKSKNINSIGSAIAEDLFRGSVLSGGEDRLIFDLGQALRDNRGGLNPEQLVEHDKKFIARFSSIPIAVKYSTLTAKSDFLVTSSRNDQFPTGCSPF